MTIEKQTNGNYTITDGKVFADLQPISVMDYVRNFLIGDMTDPRIIDVMDIKTPIERQIVINDFETRARIKKDEIR